MEMASKIRVIGEERDGPTGFEKARDWLSTASRVVFLGFSYDATNMERLGLSGGLKCSLDGNQLPPHRVVQPLMYGMENAERFHVSRKYFSEFSVSGNGVFGWTDLNPAAPITQYLRRYGGLTDL
jgi:hypothetical protein